MVDGQLEHCAGDSFGRKGQDWAVFVSSKDLEYITTAKQWKYKMAQHPVVLSQRLVHCAT